MTFTGQIVPMTWGNSAYTVLPVPAEIVAALGPTKRVEGEINEHPINLALTKAPALEDVFLWTGKTLLDRAQLKPGEHLEVRLKAVDSDVVEVPPDLRNALRSAGVTGAWDAQSAGKRRNQVHLIETAKRSETRAKRISKLLTALGADW